MEFLNEIRGYGPFPPLLDLLIPKKPDTTAIDYQPEATVKRLRDLSKLPYANLKNTPRGLSIHMRGTIGVKTIHLFQSANPSAIDREYNDVMQNYFRDLLRYSYKRLITVKNSYLASSGDKHRFAHLGMSFYGDKELAIAHKMANIDNIRFTAVQTKIEEIEYERLGFFFNFELESYIALNEVKTNLKLI